MAFGILGLEMSLHHHNQQELHHQQQRQNLQMVTFSPRQIDNQTHSQNALKQKPYLYTNRGNPQQQIVLSDEDEPGFTADEGCGNGRKRDSPWQRMKWTDNMVKLLIMVVFYIEEDGGGPENIDISGTGKKKSGGLLQKKGKWKSVSMAMMEKGFSVSPQQCEDKFNDLNKRYKRVNDILGKGIACKVVENQSLLDSMDQIPPKMKEEVRKLLNSKHLFFREMCAYHHSGISGASGSHQSPEMAGDPSHNQQQRCFHSPESTGGIANSRARMETHGLIRGKGLSREEEEDDDGDEDEEEDDEEDDSEDEEEINGGGGERNNEREDEDDETMLRKRQRREIVSPLVQKMRCEMMNVLQDGTKNPNEKRQWMKSRSLQLEEQRVNYEWQAFELEKQRLKWIKFSGKKEREMEMMKLNNDRMKLENERMLLLLRQKDLELVDHHHHHQQQQHSSNKRPDPSAITG